MAQVHWPMYKILLNQSMEQEKYEIIVINDASTNKTKLAIKTFLGDVVYLENKEGLPATLNTGIKMLGDNLL